MPDFQSAGGEQRGPDYYPNSTKPAVQKLVFLLIMLVAIGVIVWFIPADEEDQPKPKHQNANVVPPEGGMEDEPIRSGVIPNVPPNSGRSDFGRQ